LISAFNPPRLHFFTGSIARSGQYVIYSEADFEIFLPHRGDTMPNFTPIGATVRVQDPPKPKFLLRFDQNVEYKRPTGAYPLRNFHKFCRICSEFLDALAVKILIDLLKGLLS